MIIETYIKGLDETVKMIKEKNQALEDPEKSHRYDIKDSEIKLNLMDEQVKKGLREVWQARQIYGFA